MQKKQTYPAVIVILVFISLYGCSHLSTASVSSTSKKSTDAAYHYSLGVLLRLNGKIEEATEELKQAIAADPGSSYLTTELISLYTEQGDLDQWNGNEQYQKWHDILLRTVRRGRLDPIPCLHMCRSREFSNRALK